MFTAKHISLSGIEEIHEAAEVRYIPGADHSTHGDPAVVDIGTKRLQGGTVFVMNQFGKTVSRYDLGASPIPLDVDALRSANDARDRHERDAGPFEPRELPRQPMDIRRN